MKENTDHQNTASLVDDALEKVSGGVDHPYPPQEDDDMIKPEPSQDHGSVSPQTGI